MNVPYRQLQEVLLEMSEDYVKHIWQARKDACLMTAGQVLEEAGYLPKGTTYEPWNDQLYFSVDKGTDADLAHYFHEGMIYGPNKPIFELDAEGNRTGNIVRFYSPKGEKKHPIYRMKNQGPTKPSGVYHWTTALQPGSENFNQGLYNEMVWRMEEILRR